MPTTRYRNLLRPAFRGCDPALAAGLLFVSALLLVASADKSIAQSERHSEQVARPGTERLAKAVVAKPGTIRAKVVRRDHRFKPIRSAAPLAERFRQSGPAPTGGAEDSREEFAVKLDAPKKGK